MISAVFLDRDGVINDKRGLDHVTDCSEFVFYRNVDKAIKVFNQLGLKVIVVTNQPSVARGLATEKTINAIHKDMKKRLKKKNAKIDAVYFCPHHPEKHHDDIKPGNMKYRIDCECRKPKAGMLKQASEEFGVDLSKSFMIGDTTGDVLAGKNAGCKTILLKTGCSGADGKYDIKPDYTFNDLFEASCFIRDFFLPKAVILAGGRGERLKPLTDNIPKPMLPVNGKPILLYQIELLKNYGIKNFVICGHYLFEKIKEFFGDGSSFGVSISYMQEKGFMGTGGAIKNAEGLLNSTFLLVYGDEFIRMNIRKLMDFHRKKRALATLVLHKTDHPEDSDLIELSRSLKVQRIYPKNKRRPKGLVLAKTGIYVMEPEILRFIKLSRIDLDREVLPSVISRKNVYGYVTDEYIKDVGTPDRYESIRKRLERTGNDCKDYKAPYYPNDI